MSSIAFQSPVTPSQPIDRAVLAAWMGPEWAPVAPEVPFPGAVSPPRVRGRHVDPNTRLTARAIKQMVWNTRHGRRAAR